MSKLLNDEELRKQIETIFLEWSSEITGEPRHKLHPEVDQLVMRHIDLINTQKRLYAEMVIGDYPKNADRKNISDVMAEQKARIK